MKNILLGGIAAMILGSGVRFSADTATASGVAEPPVEEAPPAPLTAAEFDQAHPIVETAIIPLKSIVIDAGTQPRVHLDEDVAKEYGELIKAAAKATQPNPFDSLPDDKLPQVFRDGTGRCVLADGFHRYNGHKSGGAKEMRVAIRNGDARDALRFSLGTNQEHGVRRTNKDKQRALKTALQDGEWATLANTDIARMCGVSEFMVREMRSAVKSPTIRQVTIRGKKTTMSTAAIGKGKGGGAKGEKSARKAAKKSGKGKGGVGAGAAGADASNETGKTPTKSAQNAAQELDKQLIKIAEAVGGDEGGKIRKAVHDGSLALTPKEIKDWSGFSAKDIKLLAPLITGGTRMSPSKAFDFIKSELSEKIVTELHNRAIGGGGTYEFEGDGVKIVVTHVGGKKK